MFLSVVEFIILFFLVSVCLLFCWFFFFPFFSWVFFELCVRVRRLSVLRLHGDRRLHLKGLTDRFSCQLRRVIEVLGFLNVGLLVVARLHVAVRLLHPHEHAQALVVRDEEHPGGALRLAVRDAHRAVAAAQHKHRHQQQQHHVHTAAAAAAAAAGSSLARLHAEDVLARRHLVVAAPRRREAGGVHVRQAAQDAGHALGVQHGGDGRRRRGAGDGVALEADQLREAAAHQLHAAVQEDVRLALSAAARVRVGAVVRTVLSEHGRGLVEVVVEDEAVEALCDGVVRQETVGRLCALAGRLARSCAAARHVVHLRVELPVRVEHRDLGSGLTGPLLVGFGLEDKTEVGRGAARAVGSERDGPRHRGLAAARVDVVRVVGGGVPAVGVDVEPHALRRADLAAQPERRVVEGQRRLRGGRRRGARALLQAHHGHCGARELVGAVLDLRRCVLVGKVPVRRRLRDLRGRPGSSGVLCSDQGREHTRCHTQPLHLSSRYG
eukprot:Rhum_TRINITY_DN15460_c4_g4::Rhum_TRINITY_DN15460_c4_g4_i1::g.158504::m.158504